MANASPRLDFGNRNLGGGGPTVRRSETLVAGFFFGFPNFGNAGYDLASEEKGQRIRKGRAEKKGSYCIKRRP